MLTVKLRPKLRVVGCPKDIEKRLPVPLAAAGMLVQKEAEILLGTQGPDSKPGEGWPAYFNPQLKKWTVASHPVMPPHRQTGELQRSVKRIMEKKTIVHIATTAPYAKDLELGTRKRGPRRWMLPALYQSIDRISRMFYKFLGA